MTATRLHNGAWQVSAIVRGYLTTRTFYGYTKREALALFRAEMKGTK